MKKQKAFPKYLLLDTNVWVQILARPLKSCVTGPSFLTSLNFSFLMHKMQIIPRFYKVVVKVK